MYWAWPLSRSVFPPSVRGASRETGGILRILHTPPFVRVLAAVGTRVGTNSHDNSQLKGREEEARAPPTLASPVPVGVCLAARALTRNGTEEEAYSTGIWAQWPCSYGR